MILFRESDANLYFLGRKDNQIKHMGYRIELEEVEAAVHSIPGIVQAVVIYKRENATFGKLVCYIQTDEKYDLSKTSAYLKEKLPEYMHPNKIVEMDELPKNRTEKSTGANYHNCRNNNRCYS